MLDNTFLKVWKHSSGKYIYIDLVDLSIPYVLETQKAIYEM